MKKGLRRVSVEEFRTHLPLETSPDEEGIKTILLESSHGLPFFGDKP